VPITTKIVSLNPADGQVYSIQHYVIKFVVSSTNRTDRHNITDILLKVALNTITLTPIPFLILAHLIQRITFGIAITWYLSSVRRV